MRKTAAVLALLLLATALAPGRAKAETAPADANPVSAALPGSFPWDETEEEILAALGQTGTKPVPGASPDASIRI